MKKINFNELEIEDISGEIVKVNCAHHLSNAIYFQATTIEHQDIGRKIYEAIKTNEAVELSDEQCEYVKNFALGLDLFKPIVYQTALNKAFE